MVASTFVIAFAGIFVLNNTMFGRRLYAMGGNEEAARLSGIRIYRVNLSPESMIRAKSTICMA